MRKNVRRILSFIVTMVMVLAVMPVFSFPMRAKAETKAEDFKYEVNEKGEITITGYTGSDTDIVIPAKICDMDVVGVGDNAFYYNRSITSVTFKGNVDNIGEWAFSDCDALTSVTFKGNVDNIGEWAFSDCDALTSVSFEGNVGDIGKNAFNGCKIGSLSFPGEVGNICESAFKSSMISNVTFSGDVGDIGESAFEGCPLVSVIFEGKVGDIGKSAFKGCNLAECLSFLGNVGDIGESAFEGCNLNLAECLSFLGNVGDIGESAFKGCNLEGVIFLGDVGDIGESAFGGCSELSLVAFNGEVGNIGKNAFDGCNALHSLTFKGEVIKYGFESDTYTGQAIPFVVKVNGVVDSSIDYTVTYKDAKEIKDAGEYTAEFTMTNPAFGPIEIKHTVKPLDLNTCDLIHGESQYKYDGEDYKERIINNILVRLYDKYIISSENYDVYFIKEGETNWKTDLNITEAGNYKVKFVSKGDNCTGEKIGNFTINPKSIKNQSIIILPVSAYAYNGQEIKPSVTVKDGNKELEKDKDYTVEYIDNTNVSRDESGNVIGGAKIKIKGIGNYNSERTESFTISPKALTITADSDTKCVGSTLIKESYSNTGLVDGDYIDSIKITGSQTDIGSSDNVPSDAVIKNEAGEDVTSCYAITYENGTLTVENHVFDQKVATDTYLAEEADFTHAARYYYSCKCREKGTKTFEAGEPLPTYTIIFDANGGSIETVSANTNAEYKLDSLPTPSYDGYNFLGWFTNETGGDEITTDTVFGANMTIYAHWEKKEEPKPAQGGTEKPETPSEPSVPETPATPEIPETPETPSEPEAPETEDVKEETKSDYLDELYAILREAIAKGGEQTINWSVGDSLPYDVMKILEENPQITLLFNYTYMGEDFNVTIRGRDVQADPKVKWCGPLYLYSIYGGYKGGENGLKESGTYIVQAGDTLSALATKFNTTIKNLVALNNIKDENLIYIGQELKY